MWHLSGLEYHVATNDRGSRKNPTIERIAGAVNAAYDSLQQHTELHSQWIKQTQYPCILASDYRSTVKSKNNLLINNLKSEIESFLNDYQSPTTFDHRFINILNSTKLSKVLTHYGLYDLILDIHKLLSRDSSLNPIPPHIIETIAATEQFDLMDGDIFRWHLSASNAFYLVTINNERHYHSHWMTEQIFYRLYPLVILQPSTYRVKSHRNNCARYFQKAMFRKLQFYHELDHYHNNHRLQHVVAGYFRKHQRFIEYRSIPPLVICITFSYFNDWIGAINKVQDVIDRIPKSLTEMQSFCESEEYRNSKLEYKALNRYYGDLHCNIYGSYRLEKDFKCDVLAVLGYLMVSNASYIPEILQSENDRSLTMKLSTFWRQNSMTKCYSLNDRKIKLIIKDLMRYKTETEEIQRLGIKYIIDVYHDMDFGMRDIGEYGISIHVPVGEERVHYIVAECLRHCLLNEIIDFDVNALIEGNPYFPVNLNHSDCNKCNKLNNGNTRRSRWYQMSWSKRMEYVMMFHFACSALANSLYLRVLSLFKLTSICHENGYYWFGIECLHCAYDLCVINRDLLPSFTNSGYHRWKRKFKKLSKERQCVWCGKGISSRKNWNKITCASCMRVEYCSKKCQKAHWKSCHRKQCMSSWGTIHRMLEQRLFSRIRMQRDVKAKREMKKRREAARHERRFNIAYGWMRQQFGDMIDSDNAWHRILHLVMHYRDGSNAQYPVITVIEGQKWFRCHSKTERKYFWTLDDGTNTISSWNPWNQIGLSAPWMKPGKLQWNRFMDDAKRSYFYDYRSKESTYKIPKQYEWEEDVDYDSRSTVV